MEQLLEFLNSHVSCRKFSGKEISQDEELSIITTAQRSPTSSNIQAYSIIGVRDQAKKKRISELSGNQEHITSSSLFLIFCADLNRLALINESKGYPFHGEYAESFLLATVDATLVASRALQAAQALGYGGVMVGAIRDNIQEISELFKLPELVYPVMGMSLGQPIKQAATKPRLPVEAIYFRENYNKAQIGPTLEQYDQTINELGHLKNREVRPDDYPDFDQLYSWTEHTARRMANDDPLALRSHLLRYLQDRGFLKK